MKVTNRCKGIDLIDRVPEELLQRYFTGGRDQDHPQEKEKEEGKMVSEEVLQISEKRREAKGKGEMEI